MSSPGTSKPVFFFSHSRQDVRTSSGFLERFYRDLRNKVAEVTGLPIDTVAVIDTDVPQGQDWNKTLSLPLSTCKSMVAILSATYFTRPNCGIELFVFLGRSPGLGIDTMGQLTSVEGLLPIRWAEPEVFEENGDPQGLIPAFLRLYSNVPAKPTGKPERNNAVERYNRLGMNACVDGGPSYRQLLFMFAMRIKQMAELPEAKDVSFFTAKDAFAYDWKQHFAGVGEANEEVRALAMPRPLGSVVAYYVTARAFSTGSSECGFAEQAITEASTGSADAGFQELLSDVRIAATDNGLSIFHGADAPSVPILANPLITRLTNQSAKGVVTLLVVDPAIWSTSRQVLEEIISSRSWTGTVLVPILSESDRQQLALVEDLGRRVARQIMILSTDRNDRREMIAHAINDSRGKILSAASMKDSGAEPFPSVHGPSEEPRR